MSYKVLEYFEDLQDNIHSYNPGDTFPRDGLEVSEERLEELSSDKNLRGVKLIEKVVAKKAESKKKARKAE